jgi:hypothetical protein
MVQTFRPLVAIHWLPIKIDKPNVPGTEALHKAECVLHQLGSIEESVSVWVVSQFSHHTKPRCVTQQRMEPIVRGRKRCWLTTHPFGTFGFNSYGEITFREKIKVGRRSAQTCRKRHFKPHIAKSRDPRNAERFRLRPKGPEGIHDEGRG